AHFFSRPKKGPRVGNTQPGGESIMARAPRTVKAATKAEIDQLPEHLRTSGLAVSALELAGRMEDAAPRDVANIARELRMQLAELRKLATVDSGQEVDAVDELAERRRARRADADIQERPRRGQQRRPRSDRSGG